MLNKLPVVEYLGAKMNKIDEHIYRVLRGEVMTIQDKTFLCIGGACSTDKVHRILGLSWWEEEEITDADVDNAILNLKKFKNG